MSACHLVLMGLAVKKDDKEGAIKTLNGLLTNNREEKLNNAKLLLPAY